MASRNSKQTFSVFLGIVIGAVLVAAGIIGFQQFVSRDLSAGPTAPSLTISAPSDADADKGKILARVNGHPVYEQDLRDIAGNLPPSLQGGNLEPLYPMLINQAISRRLITSEAVEAGLQDDPEVQDMMAKARTDVLQTVFLQRKLDSLITEKDLRNAYDDYVAKLPETEQVKARHILVDEQETAIDLIQKLDQGADFTELAREHSTGPSSDQGGNLGWFAQDEMVEPFAEAAFNLETGEYTPAPVKTEFGWHVIKTMDTRIKPKPEFAELEEQLRQQLQQQEISQYLQELRQNADIETYIGTDEEQNNAPASGQGAQMPDPSTATESPEDLSTDHQSAVDAEPATAGENAQSGDNSQPATE